MFFFWAHINFTFTSSLAYTTPLLPLLSAQNTFWGNKLAWGEGGQFTTGFDPFTAPKGQALQGPEGVYLTFNKKAASLPEKSNVLKHAVLSETLQWVGLDAQAVLAPSPNVALKSCRLRAEAQFPVASDGGHIF